MANIAQENLTPERTANEAVERIKTIFARYKMG